MTRVGTLALVVSLLASTRVAAARDATVTARTPATIYLDAGTAEGLAVGRAWKVVVAGGVLELRITAVASHSALVEIVAGITPSIGATVPLPDGLTPPPLVQPRPPPAPQPTWRDDPAALRVVQRAAQRDETAPASPSIAPADRVRGEIALTAFVAGDAGGTSTSWQDLALSSQLEIVHGAWRYDHVLDAHLVGAPELWTAPLQHASARFDVYLLRLAYAPFGGRYAAALGRQPGAPLGELGSVDGARARLALGAGADVTVFGGVRPSDTSGLSTAPRAGADLGWQSAGTPGLSARADLGVAVDASGGALDRLQSAGSLSLASKTLYARGDAVIDLAADAAGASGPRVTRASLLARMRHGRLTGTARGGYDRPFLDHELAAALVDLAELRLGRRTFGEVDARYAMTRGVDVGAAARGSWGDGVWSGYAEANGAWTRGSWRLSAAPHAVLGTLTDELGVRGGIDVPWLRWQFGLDGSVDRITSAVASAWSGAGRLSASRAFRTRWRTSLAVQVAAGDGPARLLVFALLGYRIGD